MVSPTIRLTALRIGAVVMFLVLAGATYQGVATALERRAFPRPGGMVAVGDHQLHIHCTGEGAPTVVLEAPAAGLSAAWGAVQPEVARLTRVCAYDRAGLGWSERGDAPYDPSTVPGELHTLLGQAKEPAPFVIAGQGLGAAFATLFASRFADDVAALILIDDPGTGRPQQPALLMRRPGAMPWLARTGILRAAGGLCSMTTGLPEPARSALCAFLNRPDHLSRTAEELSRWDDAVSRAAGAPVGSATRAVRVDVRRGSRAEFLGAADAGPVVRAITAAVHAVRRTAGAEQEARMRVEPVEPADAR